MTNKITLEALPNVPYIEEGDDVGQIISDAAQRGGISFEDNDVLCVASKAVSIAEGRFKSLDEVEVGEVAKKIHEQAPRKDPRTIQVIIDESGAPDGSRIELDGNYIGAWLPNGQRLTSGGVDKNGQDEVILLPVDPDASARAIGQKILQVEKVMVGVIITDSDGRVEKRGSTQVAIGVYGVPPVRVTESAGLEGSLDTSEETLCDMMAAAAGIIMGQRGTNKPVVLIRGHEYTFDDSSTIKDALSRPA